VLVAESGSARGKGIMVFLFGLAALGVVGFACAGVLVQGFTEGGSAPAEAAPAKQAGAKPEPTATPAAEPTGGAGATVAAIQSRGVLRVAMDTGEPPWTGTPPMYFRNAEGRDDGFDYQLAQRIATALSVPRVEVVHAKYGDLPALLADPAKVDLLISGYSPADEAGISWSEPYLEYGLCLVVPTPSKVQTTADLWGKSVGIFDDDAAAADVQKLVKGYKDLVRLEDGYWDQLLSGRFDGFIYDYPYAVAEINAFYKANPHRAGAFRIAQFNLTDSTYAVGARSAEADLLAAVNGAIETWRASDAYADAVRAYLSANLAAPAAPKGARAVKVVAGDTLSGIAARELGAKDRWKELWELNKARFPNPHLIEVGDEVVLP